MNPILLDRTIVDLDRALDPHILPDTVDLLPANDNGPDAPALFWHDPLEILPVPGEDIVVETTAGRCRRVLSGPDGAWLCPETGAPLALSVRWWTDSLSPAPVHATFTHGFTP